MAICVPGWPKPKDATAPASTDDTSKEGTMKTKDPRARDERQQPAQEAEAQDQPVKDADPSAPLERRLRALLEAEQGAFEKQRHDAESRLQEAQGLIIEARTESEREKSHV